jgi:hypothetical protein
VSKKYQPAFVDITLNIKKSGALKIVDGDLKWNTLKGALQKLIEVEVLRKIQSDLNSSSLEEVFNMIIYFNKLISVFNQVSSPFEIYNSVAEIILVINNLINCQILEKIFLIYSMADSPANLYVIYRSIKIFKKLISICQNLFELHNFSNLNDLNYTKGYENEIKFLQEYFDNQLIPSIIQKINYFFEHENKEINNSAMILALQILKRDGAFINMIINQTNFLNCLLKKIQNILSGDNQSDINNLNPQVEIKKCLVYCIHLSHLVITIKDNLSSHFVLINSMLNKMLHVADSLRDIFFSTSDYIFQYYYIVLVGLLTKRTNFDDRVFLLKAHEVVNKNILILIRPYYFYIKNLLNSKVKKDVLQILAETKTLEFLESIVENNKSQEFFISEFLDILSTVVEDYKGLLITSTLLKDIIFYFSKILNNNPNQCAMKKIVSLLKILILMKEPIVDTLIIDSEVINLILKLFGNFTINDSFYLEIYGIKKTLYDILTVGDTLNLLSTLIQSQMLKSTAKFFKIFNLQSMKILIDFFNYIFPLYKHTQDPNPPQEVLIFEKYKDLVNFNILSIIKELLEICENSVLDFYNQNSSNVEIILDFQIENFVNFLDKSLIDIKGKCFLIEEQNYSEEEISNTPVYDEIFIYVQNKTEVDHKLFTTFRFVDPLSFSNIVDTIQKHYKSELAFYYLNENTKCYEKIKDENDFTEFLKDLYKVFQKNKREQLYMRIFVDEIFQGSKFIYVSTCINCYRKFEIEEKEFCKNNPINLCEECRSTYLNQIVNNISMNNSRSSPFKSGIYSSIYNYK